MRITLLACYEQGHQPFNLASPLAVLRQAGFEADAYDTSVQRLPEESLSESSLVAISTPMHTALKLANKVAERVRQLNPEAHICFYGLYAWLNADLLLAKKGANGRAVVDSVVGGEFEAPLLALARRLDDGLPLGGIEGLLTGVGRPAQVNLRRPTFSIPDRSTLPGVDQYAKLAWNGELLAAGYTEATRGCLHRCRHCPVVPIYNGRFFVVPVETVLADIRQQVSSGARHITFGDPDFLNGPGHALKVARAMRDEFTGLSFDFTTKVEHIIQHEQTVGELASLGAAFVISAFESTSDQVLERLRKDHTLADMEQALATLDAIGLPIQTTWVPFTPWTSLADYLHMLGWIREQELVQHVAPVQLSIRLLVPPGSALLDHPDRNQWAGPLDERGYSYRWRHDDPRMDVLQRQVAECVEQNAYRPTVTQFELIEAMAYALGGRRPPSQRAVTVEPAVAPPRLTEDWFC
ncbi:MAG: CUAEP/CCAEP-tail radical SAM protein [Chloroflexota bacterium]|jgi:radical SAM superfamily enzyme YgiQ (UPF0313 family)